MLATAEAGMEMANTSGPMPQWSLTDTSPDKGKEKVGVSGDLRWDLKLLYPRQQIAFLQKWFIEGRREATYQAEQ